MKTKDNYFNVKKYTDKVMLVVLSSYLKGSLKVSLLLGKNPPSQHNKESLKNLARNTADLIKGVTDEMSKKIRLEIRESILANEDNRKLAKRLDNIFKGDNPTRFRYENRLKMIARTESTRAMNVGAYDTAEKLGAKKKYINIVLDNRTTDVSKAMFKKYGSEDKAIPIDEEFFVNVGGKEYRGQYPPFQVNDRDMVLYTFE